jgi:inward rectifier potassium channel
MDDAEAEFIVLIKAFDDTFSQNVHTRTSYKHDEIVWNSRFKPAFYTSDGGFQVLDLSRINDHEKVGIKE